MSRIPAWLAARIETATGAPLGGRYARANLCRRCETWTLLGLDGDVLATQVRVDPSPITAAGELACLLTGRATYMLTIRAGRYLLDDRDPWRIAGRPPAAPGATYAVLAAHLCHRPLPDVLVASWPPSLTPTATVRHANPPY